MGGADLIFYIRWNKHGRCSGVTNVDDYFSQVCTLASIPIAIMRETRNAHGDIFDMARAIENANYSIFSVDNNTETLQILLSACALETGQWILASQGNFSELCSSRSSKSSDNDDKGWTLGILLAVSGAVLLIVCAIVLRSYSLRACTKHGLGSIKHAPQEESHDESRNEMSEKVGTIV